MILGVWGPPGGLLEPASKKAPNLLCQTPPFGGAFGNHFGSQIRFLGIVVESIFYLFLASLLRGLRHQFGRNLGSFWVPFGGQVAYFFAIAAKL